jgi:carboxymethylenebutenolidase
MFEMHRICSITGFCFLLVAATCLQSSAKTENVSFKSGNDTISGYLILPDSGGKHSGLVVNHEWWGLNDWVREQARKFAEQGYVELAVDLYRGKTAPNPDEAHELMRGLPQDRAIRDMRGAFA